MMTYEEFLEKISKLIKTIDVGYYQRIVTLKIGEDDYWQRHLGIYDYDYNAGDVVCAHFWEVGGVSGGSCWDSSDPQSYRNDNTPKADFIDYIFDEFMPEISFIKYKLFRQKSDTIITNISYTDHEYYGNCTDYEGIAINLKKMYDYIMENQKDN